MPEFIDTMARDLQARLEQIEQQLGDFDALVQERDRLRAALAALEVDTAAGSQSDG